VRLPNATSLERTTAATADVEKILMNAPGVEHVTSFVGFSLLSFVRTSYNSTFFVTYFTGRLAAAGSTARVRVIGSPDWPAPLVCAIAWATG
jgi:multidrug efflux pump subunit AcrB